MSAPPPTVLEFAAGHLLVRGWPEAIRPPPLLQAEAPGLLRGPARARGSARRALAAAGLPYVDRVTPPIVPPGVPPSVAVPPATAPMPRLLAGVLGHGGPPADGIRIGLPLPVRAAFVHVCAAANAARTLIVVPDTGALAAWRRELLPLLGAALGERHGQGRGDPDAPVVLATDRTAAADIRWLGNRYEMLVVDALELALPARIATIADCSAARWRFAFATCAADLDLMRRGAGIGPVVAVHEPAAAPPVLELRLPLTAGEREDYEASWHEFFAAFDRFGTMRAAAAFGDFVRWARSDPAGRPGLLAWHRSVRTASWTGAKAAAVALLLERHRRARLLLFTPDCATAYELARRHLIVPVTAELPRSERDAALQGFARGALRVLAGPRLLETGIPEGTADVGVLIGCSQSRAQRRARAGRIAPGGLVYELLSRDTLEVGRARRLRGSPAATTLAVD